MGFVHRDLKPENIVLNLDRPILVALIDFDRALPRTNTCHTGSRGTPGYQPDHSKLFDGDATRDLYSLVVIIAECDMGQNEYMKVKDERGGKEAIKKHLKSQGVCKQLTQLAESVIFEQVWHEPPTLDEVAEIVKKINFKKKV